MKQPFGINFESGQYKSMGHFCLIAGDELLNSGYRAVESLLLLLAVSEIIPGLAGTLGDCGMSECGIAEFIHHVWEKPLLFMLILVGNDERSFPLQINITKYVTSIVQWVKDFSMIIISLYIFIMCSYCISLYTLIVLWELCDISFDCKYY